MHLLAVSTSLSTTSAIMPRCYGAVRPLMPALMVRPVSSVSTPKTPSKPPRSASVPNVEPGGYSAYTPERKRLFSHTGEQPKYKLGKHRSNALELVHRIPVIEVDGEMAICDGGGGGLGHPLEYISLEVPGSVEACKYCSLRFTQKPHH